MKKATKFQIFFNFFTAGIEEVVEMLVVHGNLHNISLHFQFIRGQTQRFMFTELEDGLFKDTRRATEELMPILNAVQGPEADRWKRLPDTFEPLRQLTVENDIRVIFHSMGDPKGTVVVPPFILRDYTYS